MVLLALSPQRAYAATPAKVTLNGDRVEGPPAGNECNDPCSATYALTITIVGSGSVGKQPDQTTYLHGTFVNLTASAGEGFVFSGWSGACAGTGVCSVAMDISKSVTDVFRLISGPPNDAPSLTSSPVLDATAGANYTYFVTANDPDTGDSMILSAPVKPTWLTLMPTGNGTATLTGMPSSGDIGAHLMQLQVQGASGAFATQTFILIVAPEPAMTSSVQGIVVDRDGSGVGGAIVILLAANGDGAGAAVTSQFTDSNGAYLFADVQPGDYTVIARTDDQTPAAHISVTVMPGQPATVAAS
jgi:hypothetical protein